jgi:hypothetical protein
MSNQFPLNQKFIRSLLLMIFYYEILKLAIFRLDLISKRQKDFLLNQCRGFLAKYQNWLF